jgi:hypothetical protein
VHRPQLSKKKRDEQYQKGLYYEYGLLGYQAASYKQKKGKRFQKKRNANTTIQVLGAVLRPDPEGWEHGI